MIKNGKKTVYVNSNIYTKETNKSNFSKDSLGPQIPDTIRYYSSNFWTLKNNNLVKNSTDKLFDIEFNGTDTIILKANKSKFFEDTFENGILKKQFNKNSWNDIFYKFFP